MDKVHIVITGRRNTGKSSLVNAILGQSKAIVSDTPGTTTDPVKKAMKFREWLPLYSSTQPALTIRAHWEPYA